MEIKNPSGIKILVAIEDTQTQDFVTLILMGEGYTATSYASNSQVLEHLKKEPVDLIITDFKSARINGIELCKNIRDTLLFSHTPLLLILPEEEMLLKTKSIYAGADDFITKPFSSEELIARIKASLLRMDRYQDVNSLTKLPGVSTATRELKKHIESLHQFGVVLVDLNNFKTFNDRYGFERGDQILDYISSLIRSALVESGSFSSFLSHFGADDFLFICSCDKIDAICQGIIDDFQNNIANFYDEQERASGHILLTDGRGTTFEAPLLRINMGVVTNEQYPFFSTAQIIQIATELKDHAKATGRNAYSKEQRAAYPFI